MKDLLAHIWRTESGRIIGSVARIVRDLQTAEEIAQEAILSALEHWPSSGIPDNPSAWLMTTARNRSIDFVRREQRRRTKGDEFDRRLSVEDSALSIPPSAHATTDDRLGLIFACCHPALAPEHQIALTLRTVAGLTTPEVARALLVAETTLSQRLVRAKRLLRRSRVSFDVPPLEERSSRLQSVLQVIYLVFNEGFTASEGENLHREELCKDAVLLGTILVESFPNDPEALGLLALMELQLSRHNARTDGAGNLVLLEDQNRSLWDRNLIAHGFGHLSKATLAGPPGIFQLQAHIAACHAGALCWEDTDWSSIVALYERLVNASPTMVIRLNHTIAVSMTHGPEAALRLIDTFRNTPSLRRYALLPAARADFLRRLGRFSEAKRDYGAALKRTKNSREQAFLRSRIAECEAASPPPNEHIRRSRLPP